MPLWWDFEQYNLIVQQIEACSDSLKRVGDTIEPSVGQDRKGIAQKLLRKLRAAEGALDIVAMEALALYDPGAVALLESGCKRDPRRDLFKTPPAAPAARPRRLARGQKKRGGR